MNLIVILFHHKKVIKVANRLQHLNASDSAIHLQAIITHLLYKS